MLAPTLELVHLSWASIVQSASCVSCNAGSPIGIYLQVLLWHEALTALKAPVEKELTLLPYSLLMLHGQDCSECLHWTPQADIIPGILSY